MTTAKKIIAILASFCVSLTMTSGMYFQEYKVPEQYAQYIEAEEKEKEAEEAERNARNVTPLSPFSKTKATYFKRFDTREEFIDSIALLAVSEMEKNDILASVTIAQAMLESACGKSNAAQNRNNLFGIRAYNGNYMIYENIQESFVRHSKVLCKRRYNNASRKVVGNHDYESVCKALTRKYAMDPKYDIKLIDLIETYDLTRFDSMTTSDFFDDSNQIKIITEEDARQYAEEYLLYSNDEDIQLADETIIDIIKHILFDRKQEQKADK